MPNTIDISFFFGDILVAQKSQSSVAAEVQMFIDNYEPKLLNELFGYELYKAYKAGIVPVPVNPPTDPASYVPVDQRWLDLRDGKEYTDRNGCLTKWNGLAFTNGTSKKSLIANYVYYWYIRANTTDTTGSGEVASDNQNATPVSPATKMARAWNEMVAWNKDLVQFLISNQSVYPEFTKWYNSRGMSNLLLPINSVF